MKELFLEKFPLLSLMSFNWKAKKLSKKAFSKVALEGINALYVYGLERSDSYFFYQDWLKQEATRRLIFLEKDSGVIAGFIEEERSKEILSDPQVHLELLTKDNLQTIVDQFPFEKVEVIGPSSLRLEILRKTAVAYSLKIDRLHGYELFSNFLKNLSHLPHSFYANALKGAYKDVPAIICGAGPSLQNTIETLRTLEDKALIIAGGSSLAALSSQGIKIHFGMAIDPNLEEYHRLKNSFAFETPLLYSTRVHPSIFQTCSGPFGYMRTGIGGLLELWLEEELSLGGEFIGQHLTQETMSVTAVCIAWAQYLGCNPILLNGIDMAYTNQQRYAKGVVEDPSLQKGEEKHPIKKKDRTGKVVNTAVRWILESKAIGDFAKKHPTTRFINTTDEGIGFEGIGYMPLKKAVENFETRPLEFDPRYAPLQNTTALIASKISALEASLETLIKHLEVLAGERSGSKALAEVEIGEEIASLYLFYDIRHIFKKDDDFWKNYLALARKYKESFCALSL